MCRFVLYTGPEITLDLLTTRPRNSLIHQSFQAEMRKEPLNGDGFGIAWYAPAHGPRPAVFRSIQPAWNNLNLRNIARVTSSKTILAHVRAASPGLPVMQTNCHPFTFGPLAFCHNGYISGFAAIKRRLRARLSDRSWQQIQGSTDSEHIFALILERLAGDGPWPLQVLRDAMTEAIEEVVTACRDAGIQQPCQLNLALTDGERAVVCRYTDGAAASANTLFVHEGRRYVCDNGVCHMLQADKADASVIVASEPLSDDPGWQEVPTGCLVLIGGEDHVQIEPMTVAA